MQVNSGNPDHTIFNLGKYPLDFIRNCVLHPLRSCFLSSFVEFCSAVSTEKSKMSQAIRGQGCHLVFPIGPINTNLVEGFEILLPIKFR